MATSIIKTDEIRRLNDQVLMSDGALTSNVVFPAVPQFISAWARITATASGSETIADGYNFSGITRQEQGVYRITFSSSAPITNTNYMVFGQAVVGSTTTAPLFVVLLNGDTKTTTEFDFYVSYGLNDINTGRRDYSTWNEIHLFVIGGF
jgi:hypothetical protein